MDGWIPGRLIYCLFGLCAYYDIKVLELGFGLFISIGLIGWLIGWLVR